MQNEEGEVSREEKNDGRTIKEKVTKMAQDSRSKKELDRERLFI